MSRHDTGGFEGPKEDHYNVKKHRFCKRCEAGDMGAMAYTYKDDNEQEITRHQTMDKAVKGSVYDAEIDGTGKYGVRFTLKMFDETGLFTVNFKVGDKYLDEYFGIFAKKCPNIDATKELSMYVDENRHERQNGKPHRTDNSGNIIFPAFITIKNGEDKVDNAFGKADDKMDLPRWEKKEDEFSGKVTWDTSEHDAALKGHVKEYVERVKAANIQVPKFVTTPQELPQSIPVPATAADLEDEPDY